jgi:death-on-curing protein
MRHLTVDEILELHRLVFLQSGGANGIRDLGALDSAVAQTRVAFQGIDLYPTIVEKAAALGYSLIMNHPFVDGNKRVGHAAMETFLVLNGFEIRAAVEEQEKMILRLAAGTFSRDEFVAWLGAHVIASSLPPTV